MRNYTKIYITPKGERAARSGKLPILKELMPMAIWLML